MGQLMLARAGHDSGHGDSGCALVVSAAFAFCFVQHCTDGVHLAQIVTSGLKSIIHLPRRELASPCFESLHRACTADELALVWPE